MLLQTILEENIIKLDGIAASTADNEIGDEIRRSYGKLRKEDFKNWMYITSRGIEKNGESTEQIPDEEDDIYSDGHSHSHEHNSYGHSHSHGHDSYGHSHSHGDDSYGHSHSHGDDSHGHSHSHGDDSHGHSHGHSHSPYH